MSMLSRAQPLSACIAFYRAFDENGDGQLTATEFVTALKAYGRATGNPNAYRRRMLLEAFDAADVSSDAHLEIEEFMRFIGTFRFPQHSKL